MNLVEVESAGGEVWLDEALVLRFKGPVALRDQLRADPSIKPALRKELLQREWVAECRRFGALSPNRQLWIDLESLPRKMELGMAKGRAAQVAGAIIQTVRCEYQPLSGKQLIDCVNRVFPTKDLKNGLVSNV